MSNNKTSDVLGCGIAGLGFIALFIICFGLAYLMVSFFWWLVCLGLGIEFSWFAALGIFGIGLILRWIISAATKSSK